MVEKEEIHSVRLLVQERKPGATEEQFWLPASRGVVRGATPLLTGIFFYSPEFLSAFFKDNRVGLENSKKKGRGTVSVLFHVHFREMTR